MAQPKHVRGYYGYKKLLSEKDFLKVRERAKQLRNYGTNLIAILYKDRRIIFQTCSATFGPKVRWTQTIEITDAAIPYILTAKTFDDIVRLIQNSSLKVHCTCPAFHYWGYKYMAWKRGYGLEREVRRPKIRNPHEEGFLCKHLYLVLECYPFWGRSLASKFKNWAMSEEAYLKDKPAMQNIADTGQQTGNKLPVLNPNTSGALPTVDTTLPTVDTTLKKI